MWKMWKSRFFHFYHSFPQIVSRNSRSKIRAFLKTKSNVVYKSSTKKTLNRTSFFIAYSLSIKIEFETFFSQSVVNIFVFFGKEISVGFKHCEEALIHSFIHGRN